MLFNPFSSIWLWDLGGFRKDKKKNPSKRSMKLAFLFDKDKTTNSFKCTIACYNVVLDQLEWSFVLVSDE